MTYWDAVGFALCVQSSSNHYPNDTRRISFIVRGLMRYDSTSARSCSARRAAFSGHSDVCWRYKLAILSSSNFPWNSCSSCSSRTASQPMFLFRRVDLSIYFSNPRKESSAPMTSLTIFFLNGVEYLSLVSSSSSLSALPVSLLLLLTLAEPSVLLVATPGFWPAFLADDNVAGTSMGAVTASGVTWLPLDLRRQDLTKEIPPLSLVVCTCAWWLFEDEDDDG
mmetsp:Transcript_50993/g.122933  ORF Transcript_50993/g.122933 Transcript_50993/m.122933 type:complete len:223 (-) Transcript_50993:1600-2268(-)